MSLRLAVEVVLSMIKPSRGTDWLDFYPGGVPAGIIFDMQVEDACELVGSASKNKKAVFTGVQAEFALIGLVACFEGFCRNQTAAIINICPQLVRELTERGRDIKLRPVDILDYAENLHTQFGSLVVERIDFGTAKAINGLYKDMLGITPLSKNDAKRFHALLEDRNLLVHCGNIISPSYAKERFIRRETGRARVFIDSLAVTPNDVQVAAQFLRELSTKLRIGSHKALQTFVKKNQLRLAKANRDAAKFLDAKEPTDSSD